MLWVWFGLAVAFLVIEVMTVDLVCIWFSASALLLGLLLAIFPSFPIAWQFVLFVFLSALLVFATRPLVRRFLSFEKDKSTNLDRLMGRVATVVEVIDNRKGTGAVRLGGIVWTARTVDGDIVLEGEYVTFERIEGNTVFVKRKVD